jgi:hypothetical protein
MITQLNWFHYGAARYITHRHSPKLPNTDIWVYLDMPQTIAEIKLLPITQYIKKRKNTLLQCTQNRPAYLEARHIKNTMGGTKFCADQS